MSIEALNWALGHMQRDDIESSTAFVLMIIANRADPEGVCWPSVRYITARTKLADSTVRACCKRIADLGLLVIEPQERSDGGKATNRYKLCINVPPPPATGDGVPTATGGGHHRQPAVPPPLTGGHETKEKTSLPDGKGDRARAAKKYPMPDGFAVSAEVSKWATERGLTRDYVEQQLEAFTDDARANRRLHADWDAALKNWLRRQPNFDRTAPRPVKGAKPAVFVDRRCAWPAREAENRCQVSAGTLLVAPGTYVCPAHERQYWASKEVATA